MKKVLLTSVMSYLLLAVFIGSAEAKKIELTRGSDPAFSRLAGMLGKGSMRTGSDLAPTAANDDIDALLAFYLGMAEHAIGLDDTSAPAQDALSNRGLEEYLAMARIMWSTEGFADLLYRNGLVQFAALQTDQPVADGSQDSPPARDRETNYITPPYYVSSPIVVSINLEDPKYPPSVNPPVPTPTSGPIKPPEKKTPAVVQNDPPPAQVPDPTPKPKKPPKGQQPGIPPVTGELPHISDDPGVTPHPDPLISGDDAGIPKTPVNPPAPVPEPATLLLLAAGLAGLVGNGLRKGDAKRKDGAAGNPLV